MVAAQAHQKGSKKSATSPSSTKIIQNIFFCIGGILLYGATMAIRRSSKCFEREPGTAL